MRFLGEKMKKCEIELELLNQLFEQWKFRLTQYWSLMIRFYLVILILTLLPLMHGTWGVNIDDFFIPIWLFPLTSMALSFVVCFIGRIEMKRIIAIKKCYDNIIKNTTDIFNEALPNENSKTRWTHQNFPIVFLVLQIILSCVMIGFIIFREILLRVT